MKFSVGVFRTGGLLLAGLLLSGCLPSAPREEEKEPHFLAGRSRVNTLDFKGAIESFEKALEANPKSAQAHFELGWLFDQKEPDPAAAIYHYERFLKLSPNSGKEEMVKTRILACKQQLAQTVSLAPGMEKQQHELEQLADENRRLRDEIEKLRSYPARLQSPTNQAGTPSSPGTRRDRAMGSGQAAVTGTIPSDVANPGRSPALAAANSRAHIVRAGETPIAIARKYGVKVEALVAANPKLDPRRLQVGQVLNVPPP
jgi:LysM repeat protein